MKPIYEPSGAAKEYGDGKVVFKDDEDELIESVAEYKYSGTDEDYERAKEFVAGLWKKAICVRATTA